MVLYQIEWARLLPIFIAQPLSAILFVALAIKILIRKRDQVSLSLAAFYSISSLSLIINLIYLILTTFIDFKLLLYFLYFLTAYLLIFSSFFLISFLSLLLNIESKFTSRKNLTILIVFGIACLLILLFPGGITLDSANNWRPIYSFEFLLVMYAFFTSIVFIPTIIFSVKLYRRFEAKNLKKKFRMLIIGIIEMLTLLYGTVLFNTTMNPIIRSFWGILSLIILISSALLIYAGIGLNL
ncbi:MAG: hypothetical protein ACXACC_00910 [Promethearchaeota archaeon]|jgi:hypothetical protein